MNDTRDQAQQAWATLAAQARTPEEHACLATARRLVPVDDGHLSWHALAVVIYKDMLRLGVHAGLNDEPATPAQAVDLDRIANHPNGMDGALVNAQTRSLFLRRGWVTAFDRYGQPAGPHEWSCILFVTEAGAAVAAAALSQPVELTDSQAAPLREIARYNDYYNGHWPGTHLTYLLAVRFRLVEERRTRSHSSPDWFVLTEAGKQALARHKARRRPVANPTKTQAELLAELAASNTKRRTGSYPVTTYDRCEANQWVRYGEKTEHGWRPLFITAAGREALTRYQTGPVTAAAGKSKHERKPARELAAGMVVRLANRSGYRNLGPDWITVHRIEHMPRAGRRPGGYQVIYLRDGQEFLYCGRAFNQITRFEIKASDKPAAPAAGEPTA